MAERGGEWLGLAGTTSLLVGALVLMTAGAVGTLTYNEVISVYLDNELEHFEVSAALHAQRLKQITRDLGEEAAFLARSGPVVRLAAGQPGERAAVEELFSELLNTNAHFVQVRVAGIADRGRELVSVIDLDGEARILAPSELEENARRPYYELAKDAEPGAVIFSRVDLARDSSGLIEPYVPVMRACSPVYAGGELVGVVIVSLALGELFAEMDRSLGGDDGVIEVVDDEGYYLKARDPSRAFGFEFRRDDRLSKDFPDLALALQQESQRSGLFPSLVTGEDVAASLSSIDLIDGEARRIVGVLLSKPYSQLLEPARGARDQALLVGGLFVLFAVALGFAMARSLTRRIGGEPGRIEAITMRVAGGELNFADGELPATPTGILASVVAMVDALKAQREAAEQQDWRKSTFSEIMRQAQARDDLRSLCRDVIEALCRALNAGQGAFYLLDPDAGESPQLELFATFAFNRRPHDRSRLALGEGLVGQAARERQAILLAPVPAGYLSIESGLGAAAPAELLIQPVLRDESLEGVLELAVFEPFSEVQRDLLSQLAGSLGVVIAAVRSRLKMAELLAEAQRLQEVSESQAAELKAINNELEVQQSELRQSEEELRVANEELQERGEELTVQGEELRVANEELEEKNEVLERQRDEVERARVELERKAQELERTGRYKSEFLANMSHELRTPLNSLLILSESLAKNESGHLDEEEVRSAEIIHSGGKDLLQLINDILDLSKIEAGRMEMSLGAFAIDDLLAALRQQLAPLARVKGLELELSRSAEAPAELVSDRLRVEQILRNLISNAVKFTAEGSVRVRVELASEAEGQLDFVVSDTGIGISPAQQQVIFEAFQQADGSTSRKYGGTGLGLTISRELASRLGGTLTLESEIGSGATFVLRLPLRQAPPVEATGTSGERLRPELPVSAARPRVRSRVILVIEDDAAFAEILAGLARSWGFETQIASRADEGARLARERAPLAIILDLGLPDRDGLELLRELRAVPELAAVPVHVISSRDELPSAEQGAWSSRRKPVSRAELDELFAELGGEVAGRVLLVEDNLVESGSLAAELRARGCEVDLAASGAAALERLRAAAYSAVILDYALGDMDGVAWLDAVEAEGLTLPPVLLNTGRDLTDAEHRALSQRVDGIVIKGQRSHERLIDEVSLFLHRVDEGQPEPRPRPPRFARSEERSLEGRTVLLVDDDMRNAFALSKVLRAQGLSVVLADNGQIALERLEAMPQIDLVLMDIMMPVVDGYEAMEQIRAQPRFAELPIIALTAKAMRGDRERCLRSGANDYLPKPVDTDRLLNLLQVWLEGADGRRP